MTLLLEGGCDVNVVNAEGWTPLIASIVHVYDGSARARLVRQLVKSGADVNKTDRKGKSALAYACALNQRETVEFLLQQVGGYTISLTSHVIYKQRRARGRWGVLVSRPSPVVSFLLQCK